MDGLELTPRLVEAYRRKGYQLLEGIGRLNLVGIRSDAWSTNTFDDLVGYLTQDDHGAWISRLFAATTDPGQHYLKTPTRVEGTAILVHGQYLNSHSIGRHKGQYEALVQVRPMRFWRDRDKDEEFDFDPDTVEESIIGCNIHRAGKDQTSTLIDRWSAACQVLASPSDFDKLMRASHRHVSLRWGGSFNYTLFEEQDVKA
jgi:hypothetical protein